MFFLCFLSFFLFLIESLFGEIPSIGAFKWPSLLSRISNIYLLVKFGLKLDGAEVERGVSVLKYIWDNVKPIHRKNLQSTLQQSSGHPNGILTEVSLKKNLFARSIPPTVRQGDHKKHWNSYRSLPRSILRDNVEVENNRCVSESEPPYILFTYCCYTEDIYLMLHILLIYHTAI